MQGWAQLWVPELRDSRLYRDGLIRESGRETKWLCACLCPLRLPFPTSYRGAPGTCPSTSEWWWVANVFWNFLLWGGIDTGVWHALSSPLSLEVVKATHMPHCLILPKCDILAETVFCVTTTILSFCVHLFPLCIFLCPTDWPLKCDGTDLTAKIQELKFQCIVFLNIPRFVWI